MKEEEMKQPCKREREDVHGISVMKRELLRLAITQRKCVGINVLDGAFQMSPPSVDGNVLQREAKQRLTDYQRSQLLEY